MPDETYAQITYDREDGINIHSDLNYLGPITAEHRQVLHDCLDEFLDNYTGTGVFTVGDIRAMID